MTRWFGSLLGAALSGCASEEPPPADAPPVDTGAPVVEADPPCQLHKWFADADGDGHGDPYALVEDCDQPAGHVDNYTDCDDTDADARPDQAWYADADGDGFGDPATETVRCQRPLEHVTNADDCDDTDETRNPDRSWYADADGDAYGDPDSPVPSCEATAAEVPDGTDCDDDEPFKNPGRTEVCDYLDNNCNGLIDDEDEVVDPYTREMFYRDDDGDDYGTTEELGMFCASSDPGATVDTDCDDTTDLVNPGRIELPDDVDQNCDGETAFQYVTAASEGIYTTGVGPGFRFGGATTADLDGDGLAEVVLQGYTDTDTAGQVRVLPGTTPRDFSDAGSGAAVWTGDAEGDYLGYHYAVALPGDMDGDGTVEMLVTSRDAGDGAGEVYLLNGIPASGDVSTAATWSWTGPASGVVPTSIAPLGDIDADGYDDILVGTPAYTGGYTRQGATWVISGASVGVSSEVSDGDRLLADVEGSELTRYTSFGTSVVNAGDMDGDGEDEVLVGHPQVPLFQANGRLYRFSATDFADPAVSTADADRYTGAEAGHAIGSANVAVGDVNGDGYADILTRSGSHQMAGYANGTIFLFYGAVTLPADTSSDDADVRIGNDLYTLNYSGDPLWADDVCGLGDINGDGADDLLIASSGADFSGSYANNGTASLFLGGPRTGDQGLLGSADVRFWGRQMYGARPVLAPGDLDGDGLDDFFIGHKSPTDATLYFFSGALFP